MEYKSFVVSIVVKIGNVVIAQHFTIKQVVISSKPYCKSTNRRRQISVSLSGETEKSVVAAEPQRSKDCKDTKAEGCEANSLHQRERSKKCIDRSRERVENLVRIFEHRGDKI